MQLSAFLALLPALALALPTSQVAGIPGIELNSLTNLAPLVVPSVGSPIPGRFIVKLKNENLETLINTALKLLQEPPAHVYKFGGFGGFAANIPDEIVTLIRRFPGVRCS